MRAVRLRADTLVAAILVAAILLTVWMPGLRAVAQETEPLILVAVPGDLGDHLAARLQDYLNGTMPGYTVQVRERPIRTARIAALVGQQYGATLVIWATADAPNVLHHTTTGPVFATTASLTATWTLDSADIRQRMIYLSTTVGQAAALIGACDSALKVLNPAIAHAPADWDGLAEASFYRGVCRAQQGDFEGALADFSTAVARRDAPQYRQALAWTHFNLGEVRLALAAMGEAIALAPGNAELYLDRATFHERDEDAAAVIADLTAALTLDPHSAEAYRRRGAAYLATGDLEAALADVNRLVALRPDDPDALLERARVYCAAQDFQAALGDLNVALLLEPEDDDPFIFQRGLAYLYLGDYDAAVTDLQTYTAMRPEDSSGWINLAQAHEGLGHTFSAIQSYETALAVEPAATHLYSTLARLYYDAAGVFPPGSPEAADYLQRAIDAASQALRLYRQDATAHLYRALAYLAFENLENALEDLSAALRIDPALEAAYYNRAIVYTQLGDAALDDGERRTLYRAAIEDYSALLKVNFTAYSYLLPYVGYLYVELGQFTEALDHFDTYAELFPAAPPDQALAVYQGRAYLGLERYEEALAAYKAAVGGDSRFYRCEAQLAAGMIEGRARAHYMAAVPYLQAYLDQNCAANPVVRLMVQVCLAAWGRVGSGL